jgi:hypothetical protein
LRRLGITIVLLAVSAAVARAETFEELRKRFRAEKGRPYAERIVTVQALAATGTEEAARFLLEVVREDEDRSIQLNTIHQVARMPFRFVFDTLLAIYEGDDDSLRSTALHAIVYNREEPLPERVLTGILEGTDQGERSNAIRYLGRRKDARFLPEVKRFLLDFPTGSSSLISILVEAKTVEAARILLRIHDTSRRYDRDQVTKVFEEGDEVVRAVLSEAIASGRRKAVIDATEVASRAKVPEAEPAMVAAVERAGKDTELHAVLVEGIGAVGATTETGRGVILAALGHESEEIQVAGVRAARKAPAKATIPLLIGLLDSKSRVLAAETRVSLERVTGQQYGERRDLWERWWSTHGEAFDLASVKPRADDVLDQALVDLAIEKGAAALLRTQGEKVPWEYASHPVGTTALVVLALDAAGLDRKNKGMRAAIDFIAKADVPDRTYDTGLVAMALEAVGGKRYKRRITECARRLEATQLDEGLWGYPTGNGDNSNTQYAVLGLRAAARAGVRIKRKTWERVWHHLITTRCPDGGYSYTVQNATRGSSSMTAAGVSCLLICLENAGFEGKKDQALREAIEGAFKALGEVMQLDKDSLYALYAIERAGVLGRRKSMGGKPWYAPGARRLVDEQGRDGLWRGSYNEAVETAFAILFLKRATAPLAVSTR